VKGNLRVFGFFSDELHVLEKQINSVGMPNDVLKVT